MTKTKPKSAPREPETFDEFVDMIKHVIMNGDKEDWAKIREKFNNGDEMWQWAKMKILTDCFRAADAKGMEEFCMMAVQDRIKQGTAKKLPYDFVDYESGVRYRQYMYSNGLVHRFPYAEDCSSGSDYNIAMNTKFLGDYMEMRTAGSNEVELILLDTQHKVESCNRGDYFRHYPSGSFKKDKVSSAE